MPQPSADTCLSHLCRFLPIRLEKLLDGVVDDRIEDTTDALSQPLVYLHKGCCHCCSDTINFLTTKRSTEGKLESVCRFATFEHVAREAVGAERESVGCE